MFKKKIKVQIPIKHKCSKCGRCATIDSDVSYYITHDNVCVVNYKCECGQRDVVRQNVKFV